MSSCDDGRNVQENMNRLVCKYVAIIVVIVHAGRTLELNSPETTKHLRAIFLFIIGLLASIYSSG
jgi:hypothetical protein